MISKFTQYVILYGLPNVQIRGLVPIYESALKALPGKPTPLVKDHSKSKNPNFFRYGETWVDKLNNSSSVSRLCCISDLVRFMVREGQKIMKGSVHEDDFLIVHRVLQLVTAKSMITWTQKISIYINGCQPLMDFKIGCLISEALQVIAPISCLQITVSIKIYYTTCVFIAS